MWGGENDYAFLSRVIYKSYSGFHLAQRPPILAGVHELTMSTYFCGAFIDLVRHKFFHSKIIVTVI